MTNNRMIKQACYGGKHLIIQHQPATDHRIESCQATSWNCQLYQGTEADMYPDISLLVRCTFLQPRTFSFFSAKAPLTPAGMALSHCVQEQIRSKNLCENVLSKSSKDLKMQCVQAEVASSSPLKTCPHSDVGLQLLQAISFAS